MKKSEAKKGDAKKAATKPVTKAPSAADPKPQGPSPETKARPKRAKAPKEKKMSGLDSAAKVLAEAGEPLQCGEVAKRTLEAGLWKTSGKTPAATLHAAIIREIKAKGKESRFRKTGRGLFAAATKRSAPTTAAR
jgi:hypothetical protein